MNLKVITKLLQTYGLEVSAASSGFEALEMAKRQSFDIIFMDHMMPEMFLSSGFSDFLSKPIVVSELERVLDKFFAGHRMAMEPGAQAAMEPGEREDMKPAGRK